MRKPVRGALQGCPSKGLAASQQDPPAPNTAALFPSECVSRGLGCVSSGVGRGRRGEGYEGEGMRQTALPSSDSAISSATGLITPEAHLG